MLTYGVAVEKLRQQIVMGLLLPSERLPSERRLSEDLGVSRVTLREALRVLETEGYLSVRRGSRGGATIADAASIASLAARQVKRDPTGVYRAMEYWACNALAAVGFASTRRTPADLKRMRIAVAEMRAAESWPTLRRAETTFHLALADASANPWLGNSIRDAMAGVFLPPAMGEFERADQTTATRYDALYQALDNRQEALALEKFDAILKDRWEFVRSVMEGKRR